MPWLRYLCYNGLAAKSDAGLKTQADNLTGAGFRVRGQEEVKTMKEKIHPNYGKAIVRCVCGETFETGSVKKELRVDICSKCHPFYTGKQKLVDTGGRVDRFKKRYGM